MTYHVPTHLISQGILALSHRVFASNKVENTGLIYRKVDAIFVPQRHFRPMFPERAGHKLGA
jgi:hypothetical protein